jgi:tricorn protease
VDAIGGTARPLTMHRAHDILPAISPDGESVAFTSNRHGSYDVYVIPARSGKPQRLTFDSAGDMVCGWSPDGKHVLFASTRSPEFPRGYELYTVPAEGGRVRRITSAEAKEGAFSQSGEQIAYVRGPGSWYRQGYRGTSNDEIWICKADGSMNRQVTQFDGQDTSPMWGGDGRVLYYVSEEFGVPPNLVRLDLRTLSGKASASKPTPVAITFHREDGVRRARISRDGRWIVYECGADLWLLSTAEGASPRKLAIEVYADDKSNTERTETFTRNATEFSLSPDEKHVTFAVHGELFLLPVKSDAKAVRLTETAANNHSAVWAPDGKSIIFISDRDGHENLFRIESDDRAHPQLADAHQFKTTQLTGSKDAAFGVSFSPNGKQVAFIRAGKLWTMNPDGSDQKVVVEESFVFDYDWAPDSRWIVFARRDAFFASELYIVPAEGPTEKDPIRNITRYATYNGGVTWSAEGGHIAFLSTRGNNTKSTLHVLPVRKPAADGDSGVSRARVEIDWDYIHLRAREVLPVPVEAAAISPDGSQVAFRSSNQGLDLWVANTDGGKLTRLTTGNQNPAQIRWSGRKIGSSYLNLVYYRDGDGTIRLMRPSTDPKTASTSAPLSFSVKMSIRAEEEHLEMFDQSWRFLAESFYDPSYHGTNWDSVRRKYRPLVSHVAVKEDLYSLLYLMMGELNASHLGVSGYATTPDEPTAHLGLLFDETYAGPGLRVKEILARGPADRRGLNLKAGDYVLAIDREAVAENTNVSRLLNGKIGQVVTLTVAESPRADAKAHRQIEITGASPDTRKDGTGIADLMYHRWVEANARRVLELSKGKLGYIHIPSMDEDGLDAFVRSLYSDNFGKEGIVLDVRYNGGGFTHDRVLNYLGGQPHAYFRQRDGAQGLVLRSTDRKWTRPLVVLINNRSYSDAEIFPNAVRTLGLGKLVGEPTGGHVIGTTSVTLIDGSRFRIPRTGVFTSDGMNMEREGVRPDIRVVNHPDDLALGQDRQLEQAVDVLDVEVSKWKKSKGASVASSP